MSDVMLHGVLQMPPELWSGDAMDVIQRHSRYVQASTRIREDAARIAELERQLDACFEDAKIALASKEAETIERCAKVCDAAEELARRPSPAGQTSYAEGRRDGADCLAQAIRALGKGS